MFSFARSALLWLAAAGIGHHLIEARPFGLGATDLVCELGDDFIATLSSYLTQIE
jgi:hypothetical protein